MAAQSGKYLSFQLGTEEFAMQVAQVREIMGVQEITAVPQTPSYVRGVINLRGRVIPVVDLRLKFGLIGTAFTAQTCVIIVQIEGETGPMQVGIIVDAVSEVLTLNAADISETPDFGPGVEVPYVLGLARVKGRLKIVLQIERVLRAKELHAIPELVA